MKISHIVALLLTFTALASYINYRYFKLPKSIGITLLTLVLALSYLLLSKFGFHIDLPAVSMLASIDFNQTFLQGILSFLLFAGALHINIFSLVQYKWVILSLATVGVVVSTLLVGFGLWWVIGLLGMEIHLLYCLMFGALISPTDPIAVLGVLKTLKTPKSVHAKIVGEALFNDGMGIVLFLLLLSLAIGTTEISGVDVSVSFLRQLGGGIVFGVILGGMTAYLLRQVDNVEVAILMTLALVTGGYILTDAIVNVSGVIVMVVAGLIIGNTLRTADMSQSTIVRLDDFWALIDAVLNATLFVLIGLEVLSLNITQQGLLLGLVAIPVVLVSRYFAVLPWLCANSKTGWKKLRYGHSTSLIMTWGGIRGGIAIALALSIPLSPARDVVVMMTYSMVLFSIIIQGLTIGSFVKKMMVPRGA